MAISRPLTEFLDLDLGAALNDCHNFILVRTFFDIFIRSGFLKVPL